MAKQRYLRSHDGFVVTKILQITFAVLIILFAYKIFINNSYRFSKSTHLSEAKLVGDPKHLILRLIVNSSGEIEIDKAVATDGPLPKRVPQPVFENLYKEDLKLLYKGEEFYSIPLIFSDYIMGDAPLDPDYPKNSPPIDPRIKLEKPETTISIPFDKDYDLVIKSVKTKKEKSLKKDKAQKALSNIVIVKVKDKVETILPDIEVEETPFSDDVENNIINDLNIEPTPESTTEEPVLGLSTPGDDGYVDIAIVSSHYTDFTRFKDDAKAMMQLLLTVEPYKSNSSRIRSTSVENKSELDCKYYDGKGIFCDSVKVKQAASAVKYDSIVVIENNNNFGGGAYLGQNMAFTYRDINQSARQVFVHEFNHSFAGLFDEYDYGISWSDSVPWPNCDKYSSCSKWSGTSGTGCYKVCGYNNIFRPTDNESLMRTLSPPNGFKLCPVSIAHVKKVIASYVPALNYAPQTYPTGTCSTWEKSFKYTSLSSWWGSGTVPPTSFNAYTTRLWKGNVQELVFVGGYVWVREGVGNDANTLPGKTWSKHALSTVWSGHTNPPPTTGIYDVNYRVANGYFQELVFAGSKVWLRSAKTKGGYDFPTTWSSYNLSNVWSSSCNPHPTYDKVDVYTTRILNGKFNEIVGQGEYLYIRTGSSADANSVPSCFTRTTFSSVWKDLNPPTTSPLNLDYQIANSKYREVIIHGTGFYYRSCL